MYAHMYIERETDTERHRDRPHVLITKTELRRKINHY